MIRCPACSGEVADHSSVLVSPKSPAAVTDEARAAHAGFVGLVCEYRLGGSSHRGRVGVFQLLQRLGRPAAVGEGPARR